MARKEKVVVILEYDGERHHADGTISFAKRQLDMRVMIAQAGEVPGVRYANNGLGDSDQELEVRITAHHAQTVAGAKAVMRAVLHRLGLTVEGEIRVQKSPGTRALRRRTPTRQGATNALRVQSPFFHGKKK